jgi:hypothetical protein
MKAGDLIGKRFGKLTIRDTFSDKKNTLANCICDCGNSRPIRVYDLKRGHTKSCGCGRGTKRNKRGKAPLYYTWRSMKERCNRPKHKSFKYYGGKGVTVCEEWLKSFETFSEWCIANGWELGLEIDREDSNGNYEPSNCRFVTRIENLNNRSHTHKVRINGEIIPLMQAFKQQMITKKRFRELKTYCERYNKMRKQFGEYQSNQ